ncbi:MAG: thioredoxin family protein [Phycisphaerales bacterium]
MEARVGWPAVAGLTAWLVWFAIGGAAFGQRGDFGGGGFAGRPGAGGTPEVSISASASVAEVAPGGQFAVAVVLDHPAKLHSWPSAAQDVLPDGFEFAIRTEVGVVDAPASAAIGPAQWPEPHPAAVPNISGEGPATIEVPTYSGRAIVYLPIAVAADAPEGELVLPVRVMLQACDDVQCYIPQEETVAVTVRVTAMPSSGEAGADFAGFDASVFAGSASWGDGSSASDGAATKGLDASVGDTKAKAGAETDTSSAGGRQFLGLVRVPAPGESSFIWVLIALSAAGGFVLNLTPCVLPVIPIKVMTLTKHAGESRGRAVVLGVWMAAGVIAFWSVLAIPVLAVKGFTDPSQIFGIWYVTAGIGLIIFVMSFGLLGMFNLTLPQRAYMVNPKADSASGSFMFGVMTAVLGLPCFGFVIGALLPQALVASSFAVVAVFVSMGVGMALPYFVLSLRPELLSRVPKTGPASELVKQVMALLLMAAGVYFIGSGLIGLVLEKPYLARVLHWWAAGLFVASAGLWLLYRTVRITRRPGRIAFFGVLAAGLASAGLWVANDQTEQARTKYEARQAALAAAKSPAGFTTAAWNDYSPELVEAAQRAGKVVVLDFTAEWCLNCKALKRTVLDVDPVKPLLLGDGVVPVIVDLTARSAPGWEKLRELGQTGIPTLAVFGPGLPDGPWLSNAYTPGQVVEAIGRASGKRVASVE